MEVGEEDTEEGCELEEDISAEEEVGRLGEALLALEAIEILPQEAELGRINLIDARNRFNNLIRLAMPWTVCYRWPVGARFAFNC